MTNARKGRTTPAKRILVVDDYEDARDLLVEMLEYAGYAALIARNGAEALEVARREIPDLILMDLSLPVMDGWEATRRLKEDARTQGVPIIGFSGHDLPNGKQHAERVGCDRFVRKPAAPQDVLEAIAEMLNTERASAAVSLSLSKAPEHPRST